MLAFEPIPRNVQQLQLNAYLNGWGDANKPLSPASLRRRGQVCMHCSLHLLHLLHLRLHVCTSLISLTSLPAHLAVPLTGQMAIVHGAVTASSTPSNVSIFAPVGNEDNAAIGKGDATAAAVFSSHSAVHGMAIPVLQARALTLDAYFEGALPELASSLALVKIDTRTHRGPQTLSLAAYYCWHVMFFPRAD